MERRLRFKQLLPILTVGADVNVDEESAPQATDTNGRHQMINRRRRQDRQASRRKSRGWLQGKFPESAIKLQHLEETEPVLGKRGKILEAIRRCFQSSAKTTSKVFEGG